MTLQWYQYCISEGSHTRCGKAIPVLNDNYYLPPLQHLALSLTVQAMRE